MKFGRGLNGETGFLYVEIRGEKLWFKHDFASKAIADLVDDAITAGISDRIKEIRRAAYEEGWRDKTSRNRKKQIFNGCVTVDSVGY